MVHLSCTNFFANFPYTEVIYKTPFFVVTLFSFGIGHFLNAIIEGFFRDWYMTSDLSIPVISLASFGIFTISLMVFGRRKNE